MPTMPRAPQPGPHKSSENRNAARLEGRLAPLLAAVAGMVAVMTGNLTNTVLSLLDTLSRSRPLMEGAPERLVKTLQLVIGFFAGCIAGAVAVSWLAEWAWSLPVGLAGVAMALVAGRRAPSA